MTRCSPLIGQAGPGTMWPAGGDIGSSARSRQHPLMTRRMMRISLYCLFTDVSECSYLAHFIIHIECFIMSNLVSFLLQKTVTIYLTNDHDSSVQDGERGHNCLILPHGHTSKLHQNNLLFISKVAGPAKNI